MQADTLSESQSKFVVTIQAYIELAIQNNKPPFADTPQTPQEFWKLYETANRLETPIEFPSPPEVKIDGKYLEEYLPKQATMALTDTSS